MLVLGASVVSKATTVLMTSQLRNHSQPLPYCYSIYGTVISIQVAKQCLSLMVYPFNPSGIIRNFGEIYFLCDFQEAIWSSSLLPPRKSESHGFGLFTLLLWFPRRKHFLGVSATWFSRVRKNQTGSCFLSRLFLK